MKTTTIGFIGAGNMANSLIRGLLAKGFQPSSILASDIDSEKLELLSSECGIRLSAVSYTHLTLPTILLV